jgi:hypothetical protein
MKTKGISSIYEMRLKPGYAKGLLNEINNSDMT